MERTVTLTVEIEDGLAIVDILRDIEEKLRDNRHVKDYGVFTPRLPKYFKEGYKE